MVQGGWQMAEMVTPGLSSLTPRMQGSARYGTAALPIRQWPLSISRCLDKLPCLVPLAACRQPSAGPGCSHQDKGQSCPRPPAASGLLRKLPTHRG